MWEEGTQKRAEKDYRSVEELKKLEGFLEEKEAKLGLYELLRGNPSLAADLLLGVELFPFQHIAVKTMFETDYTLGCWSRALKQSYSTSATFTPLREVISGR